MNELPPLFTEGGARHLFATQAWKREDVSYLITQTSSNIRCRYPNKGEGANSKKKTTEAKDAVVYLLSLLHITSFRHAMLLTLYSLRHGPGVFLCNLFLRPSLK